MSRWPDSQRVAGEELLASSREARTLLVEARTLRQALAGPPVRAPAGLADRIVTAASKLNTKRRAPTTRRQRIPWPSRNPAKTCRPRYAGQDMPAKICRLRLAGAIASGLYAPDFRTC